MAKADAGTVHIGDLSVQLQLSLDSEILSGKGFIEFDQIHIVQRPTDLFQKFGECICGAANKYFGSTAAWEYPTIFAIGFKSFFSA